MALKLLPRPAALDQGQPDAEIVRRVAAGEVALFEVLMRRHNARVYHAVRAILRDEDEVFPDVLLIDGGKGQLNAAAEAFKQLGIDPPCLISLAKQEEEIFRPGESESIRLSRHSAALRLLQYVRDEAHRFAQHYHHMLRRKRLTGD